MVVWLSPMFLFSRLLVFILRLLLGSFIKLHRYNNTPFDKSNPNLVFQWEFNDTNPNLNKAIQGSKENDTIMCWMYGQKINKL